MNPCDIIRKKRFGGELNEKEIRAFVDGLATGTEFPVTLQEAAAVIAAPFWSTIEAKTDAREREQYAFLRMVFPSLLVTGPFSIVFAFDGGLMALNDRLKLRSMVVGEKDDKVFIASEESAIRVMAPDAENIWSPAGGEPVIVRVKEGAKL